MDFILFLILCAGISVAVYNVMHFNAPSALPPTHCRACDRELRYDVNYTFLGPGAYVCVDCMLKVDEEIGNVLPYWFDHPLVNGEPAAEPAVLLDPIEDSTTYQCTDCQGEHPQHTICPKMSPVSGASCISLFETLAEAEKISWIMTGQSGRGFTYDVQMMAQCRKWVDERGKAA